MTTLWVIDAALWGVCGFGWGFKFGFEKARKRIARGVDPIDFGHGIRLLVTVDMVKNMTDEMDRLATAVKESETVN